MSIPFMKSVLAVVLSLMALLQVFIMLEIFGRTKPRHDPVKLRKVHRINGRIFIILYLFIAYFCLRYIAIDKEELSARITLHAVLAFYIILLLALKIAALRIYHQAYQGIPPSSPVVLGPIIALLTLGVAALGAGYYFLVTLF